MARTKGSRASAKGGSPLQRDRPDRQGKPVGRRAYPSRVAPRAEYDYRSLYLEGERYFNAGRDTHEALELARKLIADSAGADDATWIARKIGKRVHEIVVRLVKARDVIAVLGFTQLPTALSDFMHALVAYARTGTGTLAFDREPAYVDEKVVFRRPQYTDRDSATEILRSYVAHRGWQAGFSHGFSWVEIWATAGFGASFGGDAPPHPFHLFNLVLQTLTDDPVPTDKQLADAAKRSVDTIRKLRRSHSLRTSRTSQASSAVFSGIVQELKVQVERAQALPRPTDDRPGK